MIDLRQTPQYARYMKSLSWEVVITPLHKGVISNGASYVYCRKIPLLGSIAKLQRPPKIDFKQIRRIIDEHKITAFYLEPSAPISFKSAKIGFKDAKSAFLPAKTIHIDLTKSEDQLLKEMKPKTRYNIKIARKRGVIVKQTTEIDGFISLWKSSATRRFALPQSKEISALWQAFGQKAHLLLAHKDSNGMHVHSSTVNQPLAGVLVCYSPGSAFYMYAASNKEGKKLFAPTLIAWEAIKLAKKNRCKTFDFEGIYDERYSSTKSWKGFTKFKEGFGGKAVEFPRTLVCHKNPLFKLFNF